MSTGSKPKSTTTTTTTIPTTNLSADNNTGVIVYGGGTVTLTDAGAVAASAEVSREAIAAVQNATDELIASLEGSTADLLATSERIFDEATAHQIAAQREANDLVLHAIDLSHDQNARAFDLALELSGDTTAAIEAAAERAVDVVKEAYEDALSTVVEFVGDEREELRDFATAAVAPDTALASQSVDTARVITVAALAALALGALAS
jgi:hypothetical protein